MRGREQVQSLSRTLSRLPIKAIYTSPLERTVETAEAIAASYAFTPIMHSALLEVDFGEWTGKTFRHLDSVDGWKRFNTARSILRPPGGELILEVQNRMVAEIETIGRTHADEMVAVVSHADPIRTVISHYLGSPIDLLPRFNIDPASVTAIRFTDGLPTVLYINRIDAAAV